MTSSPPPGWYSDPSDATSMRWWDGQSWTMSTQPLPAPQPVAVSAGAPTYAAAPAAPAAFAASPSTFPAAPTPYAQHAPAPAAHSATSRNRYALTTFGVVALYILVAMTTGFVLIGIVPLMLSIRSLSAKEPLGPFALVAALIALGVSISVLSGH
jgi:hypothetical protein